MGIKLSRKIVTFSFFHIDYQLVLDVILSPVVAEPLAAAFTSASPTMDAFDTTAPYIKTDLQIYIKKNKNKDVQTYMDKQTNRQTD
jgi:hypothetical protein